MLYLALQTAALIAATYFIGTFLGCLLHKFFNMLFGSNERKLASAGAASVIGAAATSGDDLHLFQKDGNGNPVRTAGQAPDDDYVLGQKIDSYIPGTMPSEKQPSIAAKAITPAPVAKNSPQISVPEKTAQVETPVNIAASNDLKKQIEIPQNKVSVPEPSLNIPSKASDDSIISKASTQTVETVAKTAVALGGVATVATAALGNVENKADAITPAKIKTKAAVTTEAAIPTDPVKKGFFSRLFGKKKPSTKTVKNVENPIKTAKKNAKVEATKPAVKIPAIETATKETSLTASKIIVPAVVAGTAAAVAKGDDVIKTVSKMSSEIITITDPKPAVKEVAQAVAVDEKVSPAPETKAVVTEKIETPKVKEIAVKEDIIAKEKVDAVLENPDAGSPLDLDLTKLSEKDLIETTKTLKAMALKDD